MNEKLNEILSDVWHRSISADEGFDAICDLIDKSAEIARLEAENKSLKDELAECKKDDDRLEYIRTELVYTIGNAFSWPVYPQDSLSFKHAIDQAIAKGKEE